MYMEAWHPKPWVSLKRRCWCLVSGPRHAFSDLITICEAVENRGSSYHALNSRTVGEDSDEGGVEGFFGHGLAKGGGDVNFDAWLPFCGLLYGEDGFSGVGVNVECVHGVVARGGELLWADFGCAAYVWV